MVFVTGTVTSIGDEWILKGPSPNDSLCLLPSEEDLADIALNGSQGVWAGRLAWPADEAEVCLDRGYDLMMTERETGNFEDDVTRLSSVTFDHFHMLAVTTPLRDGVTDPISPDCKGYVGDRSFDYYERIR